MPQLTGQIREQWSGEPVKSAVVIVNGVNALADRYGQFSVIMHGSTADIQILHIGHETLNTSIHIPEEGVHVELTMKPIGSVLY